MSPGRTAPPRSSPSERPGHAPPDDRSRVCKGTAADAPSRSRTPDQPPQWGEIAAWFNCGMPGAFLLTRAFAQTFPVTLNGVRRVSRSWGRAASDGLNQPTSLESALRHRALSTWVPDDRLPITLRAMTAPPDQSTQGVHASGEPRHSVSGGTIFRRDKR
jgi:hypothetical protein